MHSKRFRMDETIAQVDNLIRRLMSCGLGDYSQFVGDSPPADPAFHTVGAMIPAAIQLVAPFQPTDPAFDARASVVTTPEASLLLMRHSFGRLGPRLGQHHLLDAARGSIPLVRGGVDTAIPSKQLGGRWNACR
jgi:hypothetical protein